VVRAVGKRGVNFSVGGSPLGFGCHPLVCTEGLWELCVIICGHKKLAYLGSGACNTFINRLIVSDCTFLSAPPPVFPCFFHSCKANARV